MNWTKGSLLEASGAYWKSCTIHTGVDLDVFSKIGNYSRSSRQLAEETGCDLRGMEILLNALSALKLLVKEDDKYKNSDFTKKYLVKSSTDYIGFIINHHKQLVDSWGSLSNSVTSGEPSRGSVSHTDTDSERENFLMGMHNIASTIAPVYAKKLDLKGCVKLLDIGGGPGTYSVHFCLNNPELNAFVFDLPTTKKIAEKNIQAHNLSERISFLSGDFSSSETIMPEECDAVWISHILHSQSPKQSEMLIAKAVKSLRKGGKIFIHEFILNNTKDGPLFPALFSLNMLAGTSYGRAYSEKELMEMLAKNGVKDIKRLDVSSPNDAGIIQGSI